MSECAMNERRNESSMKEVGYGMKYTDNKQIREAVKAECRNQGKSLAYVARSLGILPQSLNDIFSKQHITFDDVQRIADTLDCDLYFGIVKRY